MTDSKALYSEAAHYYVEVETTESEDAKSEFDKSKMRELRHGKNWERQMVSINEICDKFAPGSSGYRRGVKYIFEGDRYVVIADMASGYLRIYDTELRSFVKIDGTSSSNDDETHFKILPREDG